jgi:hypothetical protein
MRLARLAPMAEETPMLLRVVHYGMLLLVLTARERFVRAVRRR